MDAEMGTARAAVVYYYDQPVVRGKQEVKKPVRCMSIDERVDLLENAKRLMDEEIRKLRNQSE